MSSAAEAYPYCGGAHYAKARRNPDGTYTWYCVRCGKERVMRDGLGWR